MFKSKRLSKMAAKLTAVTMCAALIGTTAPITATENDTVLLNADFEPTSESVLSKDFTDGNCATVTFENGQRPFAEIQTDENNNNYAIIDAGKYPDGEGWIHDWVNGGYLFDDGKKIENGNWIISFDFNVESGGSYANVSLAKSNVKGEEYGQFRLLGTDGTNVLVNKIALDNGTPVTNKWYHYEMKLNKTANTYTVEITDPNDASFKATQSGSVSQTYAFEGLMFGAAMRVAMDNISIMGEKINAPEFVKLGSGITCSISDGVAYIQNVGAWDYGAFLFKNAMGTAGKYEIKFDFKANNITGGYGAVYLTDSAMGGNSQPKEFQLLNIVDGKLCSGIYYTSSENYTVPILDIDLSDAEGNDKDKWFTYEMVGDRATGEWTATITERGNSTRTGTASGGNFPRDKAIDRMMFGTLCDIYIDNILVQEKFAKPSMSDERVKFLDKNGAQINCSNTELSLLTNKISLDFGTRLKEDTINNNITLVKSSDNSAVSFDYEISGTAVILKNLNLEPTTAYTLTVGSGITGKDGQKLDKTYTLNMTTGANVTTMRLANIKIGDSVVGNFAGLTDGAATVVINSTNTTADPIDAVLIMAYYDNNNRLLLADAQAVNGTAQSAADVNAPVTIAKPEGCAKVKVMLWNSLGNTKPLSAILEF
ncbi:MAG: Ig-like domain-containing protein [Eubacteriales bacterium]|nr:Ig-like domain-containing protein [Eubacteriales bacterium]